MANIGNLIPLNIAAENFRRNNDNAKLDNVIAEAKRNIENQRLLEEELLDKYDPCSGIKEDLSDSMSKIKTNELERLLTNDFYNANVLRAAQCINGQYFSSKTYSYEVNVRRWLKSFKQIGSPSVYGYALDTQITSGENIFITKAPRDQSTDLIHEYIIGVYGLNLLRSVVPNFAYILGAFKCNPPYVQEDKNVDAVCLTESKNKVTYVLYERIIPGTELADYIFTCSENDFMSVWLQLIYSLRIAQKKIGYNHNDLHTQNVLVRKLTSKVEIPYQSRGITIYLKATGVATIIDYGLSRMNLTYEKQVYTITDPAMIAYPPYGFDTLIDLFKLISFCVYLLIEKGYNNSPAANLIFKLYTFFYNGPNLDEYIKNMRDNYFTYVKHPGNKDVNLDMYLDWIYGNVKGVVDRVALTRRDVSIKLLSCGDRCITKRGALSFLDAFGSSKEKDIFDIFNHAAIVDNKEAYLKSQNELFTREINRAIAASKKIVEYSNKNIWIDWSLQKQLTLDGNLMFMSKREFIKEYREHIDEFMKMVERFVMIKAYFDIAILLIANISTVNKEKINNLSQILVGITVMINKIMESVKADINFVKSIPQNGYMITAFSKWWRLSFVSISNILP